MDASLRRYVAIVAKTRSLQILLALYIVLTVGVTYVTNATFSSFIGAINNIIIGIVVVDVFTRVSKRTESQALLDNFIKKLLGVHQMVYHAALSKGNAEKSDSNKNNFYFMLSGRLETQVDLLEYAFYKELPIDVIESVRDYKGILAHALRKGADRDRVVKAVGRANDIIKAIIENNCPEPAVASVHEGSVWTRSQVEQLAGAILQAKQLRTVGPHHGISQSQARKDKKRDPHLVAETELG